MLLCLTQVNDLYMDCVGKKRLVNLLSPTFLKEEIDQFIVPCLFEGMQGDHKMFSLSFNPFFHPSLHPYSGCCNSTTAGSILSILSSINTLRPRQNGRHFTDDTFKLIFVNDNLY